MHIAEVVTIAKSLPLLRLNTYKSLILSYSADYRRIFGKTLVGRREAFDVHKKEILTTSSISVQDSFSVRLIGLEPTRREAPDPKSGVSTNFTTGAVRRLQR